MKLPGLDRLDVNARLRAACWEAGGQKFWGERHDISPTYISDVLNARCEPGEKILAALGLRRVVRYVEIRIVNG